TCTDPLSAIVSCPTPLVVSGEVAGQSVAGSSTLKGGGTVSATVSGISIDKTPPTVTYAGNAGAYAVDEIVHVTCVATDALSLVASDTCADIDGPAYTFPLGLNTFSATASDNAGNITTARATFAVGVDTNAAC